MDWKRLAITLSMLMSCAWACGRAAVGSNGVVIDVIPCPDGCHCTGFEAICEAPYMGLEPLPTDIKILDIRDGGGNITTKKLQQASNLRHLILPKLPIYDLDDINEESPDGTTRNNILSLTVMDWGGESLLNRLTRFIDNMPRLKTLHIGGGKLDCTCDILDFLNNRAIDLGDISHLPLSSDCIEQGLDLNESETGLKRIIDLIKHCASKRQSIIPIDMDSVAAPPVQPIQSATSTRTDPDNILFDKTEIVLAPDIQTMETAERKPFENGLPEEITLVRFPRDADEIDEGENYDDDDLDEYENQVEDIADGEKDIEDEEIEEVIYEGSDDIDEDEVEIIDEGGEVTDGEEVEEDFDDGEDIDEEEIEENINYGEGIDEEEIEEVSDEDSEVIDSEEDGEEVEDIDDGEDIDKEEIDEVIDVIDSVEDGKEVEDIDDSEDIDEEEIEEVIDEGSEVIDEDEVEVIDQGGEVIDGEEVEKDNAEDDLDEYGEEYEDGDEVEDIDDGEEDIEEEEIKRREVVDIEEDIDEQKPFENILPEDIPLVRVPRDADEIDEEEYNEYEDSDEDQVEDIDDGEKDIDEEEIEQVIDEGSEVIDEDEVEVTDQGGEVIGGEEVEEDNDEDDLDEYGEEYEDGDEDQVEEIDDGEEDIEEEEIERREVDDIEGDIDEQKPFENRLLEENPLVRVKRDTDEIDEEDIDYCEEIINEDEIKYVIGEDGEVIDVENLDECEDIEFEEDNDDGEKDIDEGTIEEVIKEVIKEVKEGEEDIDEDEVEGQVVDDIDENIEVPVDENGAGDVEVNKEIYEDLKGEDKVIDDNGNLATDDGDDTQPEMANIDQDMLTDLRELLSSTKIDLPVDINDPYDVGLLLRHLRHHSDLLANIGNPDVKKAVLGAMNEEDTPEIEGAGDGPN